MRGLALKRPYGLALFYGKDIENRTIKWDCIIGTDVLIYASRTLDRRYFNQGVEVCRVNGWNPPPLEEQSVGIIGCVHIASREWGTENRGWGFAGQWWYRVENPRLFQKAIDFKPAFALGLFDVPDELVMNAIASATTPVPARKQLEIDLWTSEAN